MAADADVLFQPVGRSRKNAGGNKAGVLAQLVERLVRNEKVRGSNPLGSTSLFDGCV